MNPRQEFQLFTVDAVPSEMLNLKFLYFNPGFQEFKMFNWHQFQTAIVRSFILTSFKLMHQVKLYLLKCQTPISFL